MEACKREPAGISLADLMACFSDGKRIVADSMDTGLPVHIEEVLSGLACRCVCSGCGRRVVAHKGSMRRHFQHAVAEDHETCASPGETALHRFAKAVLSKALVLRLPELEETDGRNTVTVVREREFGFDKAILEKRQGEVVPDVVCLKDGRPLHVEFKVTHACGPEKVEKLKRMDVGAIEVDLSGYRAVALDGLEAAILTEAPRAWLHNPKSDVARRTLAKLESDRIEEVDRLAKEMVASLPSPDGREADPGPWEAEAREYGFYDHIRETRGALGFKGRGQEWKAFVLVRFGLVEKSGFTTKQVIAGLKEFGLLEERFSFVSDEVADGLRRAAGKEALSPWEAVLAFVADMKRADMLVASTDGRTLFGGKALFSSVKAAVAEAERPSRRAGELEGLVDRILATVREDCREGFDFKSWFGSEVGHGIKPSEAVESTDDGFETLTAGLGRLLEGMASAHAFVPNGDCWGLPVAAEVQALDRARQKAEEERARQVARRMKEEEDGRIGRLREAASRTILAGGMDDWMSGLSEALAGQTPIEAARQSETGLLRALGLLSEEDRALREEVRLANLRLDCLESLRRSARQAFRRPDHADVWLRSACREIGLRRPEDYCVDMETLAECLQALEAVSGRR